MQCIVCPPFTSLALAGELLKGSAFRLGAQNMSQHDEGAYTGEISAKMLKAVGCDSVILGHSERRQYFGETNEFVNLKAKKALSARSAPDHLRRRNARRAGKGYYDPDHYDPGEGMSSPGLSPQDMTSVIIAYEPVWAIGTGRTATPAQAQEVHQLIRKLIAGQYDWALAEKITIQYGGSVKPDNATEILAQNDVDGALVGGACLKADSFAAIIKAARP